ncbi:App1 family protein [Corynebacterium uterequi]|uniref:Phosphatidate phosphatase APP1 catalytic domain-containing protein n=1 Tax=Corynebacterium uterequi TaxID=1072256 RepID=A0A0G3H9T1_9CORY|nr:phosphatase domain-containing protein [Corynebacterium uterequi]AKK10094.1 hypothetical protein CUTER_00325 [Corynebacterium uterequi]
MGFSDIVRHTEHAINSLGVRRKKAAGWVPEIHTYCGYGSPNRLHVIGRVLMGDPEHDPDESRTATGQVRTVAYEAQRGYRQFFTIQVGNHPVQVRVGEQVVETHTNSNGYFDILVPDHGLEPGWHEVTVSAEGADDAVAEVVIVSPEESIGIVSDVDDTIMVTNLPRAAHAAYNSWVRRTSARQPVTGMKEFYDELLREHPTAPVFYLSTGAWNTYDTLVRFIDEHKLPRGPLLLTDWGPTPTGLFRSGTTHKKVQLRNLIIEFPQIRWVLVGDNGQHDPLTYSDLITEHPDAVAGVAIRELTPKEHILSHGTAASLTGPLSSGRDGIPAISGPDGLALRELYRENPFS